MMTMVLMMVRQWWFWLYKGPSICLDRLWEQIHMKMKILMITMVGKFDDKNIDDFQKEQVGVFILLTWSKHVFFHHINEPFANTVVHICTIYELCMHVECKVYCTCTSLYFWLGANKFFLHRSFLLFDRLSRALCQCSGLQYNVFLCIVFSTAKRCSSSQSVPGSSPVQSIYIGLVVLICS